MAPATGGPRRQSDGGCPGARRRKGSDVGLGFTDSWAREKTRDDRHKGGTAGTCRVLRPGLARGIILP
ncbi:hypothetical protein HPP92_017805 [Vanilla planifolia]|uniref:Uncharacterized protein n=1 Tax=Vanilla planifolia TaxID=51239 RepID=A0A835QIQ7_VANPL|nr:hypothetical protein HPP92_018401 [Vanilla planifolia]KAG0468477.1 hypothetical protein HPP92_017805 [Vanilla planifolia]